MQMFIFMPRPWRPVLLAALALALLPGASPGQSGPPILTVGKVTVKGGHSIRGIEDGVIFNRRFGDNCLLDAYSAVKPIAASLGQTVNLEVELISCPPSASLAASRCYSETENGYTSVWIETQGSRLTVPVLLPHRTGIHGVRLECKIGEADASLSTTLYLTYASPRPMVDPPDLDWYRRACEWGEGLIRQNTEQEVADRLLDRLFYFGQRRWRYGLCRIEGDTCVFGDDRVSTQGLRCNSTYGICKLYWSELVRSEGDRNFSDCYQFSSAFEYIAATMGIGGMVEVEELGRWKRGFMTQPPTRSLDPAFAGNLLCGPRDLACAFTFLNHDLRRRGGRFYDATFGGIYDSADELVFQSVKKRDPKTLSFGGDTACSTGKGYGQFDSWREMAPEICMPKLPGGEATFGGGVQVQTISLDGSPGPEALAVELEVVIETEGSFLVHGAIYCADGETPVTLRPERRLQDLTSQARISGQPGRTWARLIFSGDDLERSRSCAPYQLHAGLIAEEGKPQDYLKIPVKPPVLVTLSEGPASLGSAEELRLAWVSEGSGLALRATLPLNVRTPGAFAVDARLARGGETLAYGGYRREMSRETHFLEVDFPLTTVPPEGGLEISIALHWLDPLQPVASRRIENVELPPVK